VKLKLIADIVRISDGTSLGSVDLDTGEFDTTNPELLAAWDRLRRDGVRSADRTCPAALSRATLADALIALRAQGFDWRL
jgi:hypothetical protein